MNGSTDIEMKNETSENGNTNGFANHT